MRPLRRSWLVLKRTGAINIFIGYLVFMCVTAVILVIFEPQIHTFRDGIWYCFVASSTIGFGDIYVVTPVGRILTILVTVYGMLTTAMLTGVIVGYYMEYLKSKERDTISMFLEKLERLPELSQEELSEVADKVKKFTSK